MHQGELCGSERTDSLKSALFLIFHFFLLCNMKLFFKKTPISDSLFITKRPFHQPHISCSCITGSSSALNGWCQRRGTQTANLSCNSTCSLGSCLVSDSGKRRWTCLNQTSGFCHKGKSCQSLATEEQLSSANVLACCLLYQVLFNCCQVSQVKVKVRLKSCFDSFPSIKSINWNSLIIRLKSNNMQQCTFFNRSSVFMYLSLSFSLLPTHTHTHTLRSNAV